MFDAHGKRKPSNMNGSDESTYKNVALTVNGRVYNVSVKDSETLLHVLRDKLHLTGTKKGCDLGVCGVCTVLVDGEPMNSCLLLAVTMQGREITTIEFSGRSCTRERFSAATAHRAWSSPPGH
jgi:aerobic-type carbon monoxide dehydrogenase small subunit (CoxS/CutS family)